jgi:hypothetical protein
MLITHHRSLDALAEAYYLVVDCLYLVSKDATLGRSLLVIFFLSRETMVTKIIHSGYYKNNSWRTHRCFRRDSLECVKSKLEICGNLPLHHNCKMR